MNSDNHASRYPSLLHSNGNNELPFPQLPEMNMENEELAFSSYYASSQNVTNNNPNFYRPYDTAVNYNNNEESWPFVNANGVLGAGASFNRNIFMNNNSTADIETPPIWPHFSEQTYPHFSHFTNVNFWPQLYLSQASYESHHHDYRHQLPSEQSVPHSNDLVGELNVEHLPVDPPTQIPQPTQYPSDATNFPLYQQPLQQPFIPLSSNVDNVPQLPIRPIPQQAVASNVDVAFQCKACSRFCVSAGGLKRHTKFCKALSTSETMATTLSKQPATNDLVPTSDVVSSTSSSPYPVNLTSSSSVQTTNNCIASDFTPINFSTHEPIPSNTSKSTEDTNEPFREAENQLSNSNVAIDDVIRPLKPKNNQCVSRKRNCPVCQLELPSERALVEHLVLHNVAKPYACVTCGSRFSRKFHLSRHIKQRGCDGTPRAEFPCEHCKKLFSRKDNLREHMKSHTGQTKPRAKLPCPIPTCDKEFTGRTQLQVHLNFHSGLRPYSCVWDGCKKTFRSNAALKKHMRTHNCERPFQCTQCDARFAAKDSLTHHLESHNIIRPIPIRSFICNRCGMAFSQQTSLTKHITKEHEQNETFRCTICPRSYKRRWRLLHHFKTEHVEKSNAGNSTGLLESKCLGSSGSTEEQTFSCGVCSKNFTSKVSLKAHYLTHVVERPVSCTECSRAYIRRDCLLRHLRTKHNLPQHEALQVMQNMNSEENSPLSNSSTSQLEPLVIRSDTDSITDVSSNPNTPVPYNDDAQQESTAILDQELLDVSMLEGNIIELLTLLVDANALRNFGWPNCSVDLVLQAVLNKCAKEPYSNPALPMAQRLRANTKMLFSFIVDDQNALESLFSRRPVEQVLEQVVQLAKSSESIDNIVQLPL